MKDALLVTLMLMLTWGQMDLLHSQPITGTGTDKQIWQQIARDAWDTAHLVRVGELGTDWKLILTQVADENDLLFWALIFYARGSAPEDPTAESAVAELYSAVRDLWVKNSEIEARSGSDDPTVYETMNPFFGPPASP